MPKGSNRSSKRARSPSADRANTRIESANVPMVEGPPPFCLLHLSFENQQQFRDYCAVNRAMIDQTWLWHETLGNQASPLSIDGICENCQRSTSFKFYSKPAQPGGRFSHRMDWRNEGKCQHCGLSALDRSLVRLLHLYGGSRLDHIYHVGQKSRSYRWLSRSFANVQGSQYVEGLTPGFVDEQGLQQEDLTRLSFKNACFDAIYCSEVLEHIPDYTAALRECARVLKGNGRAVMSFPFGTDFERNVVRAELKADGTIQHLLEPEYHGDPAAPDKGILSYRVFGWEVLDTMRSAGFSRASCDFIFGPLHGYMSIVSPVFVGIR